MCKKEGNIGSKSDSAKVSVIKNVSRVLIFKLLIGISSPMSVW